MRQTREGKTTWFGQQCLKVRTLCSKQQVQEDCPVHGNVISDAETWWTKSELMKEAGALTHQHVKSLPERQGNKKNIKQ